MQAEAQRRVDELSSDSTAQGHAGRMSQFRSEEMNLVQLFVQSDAAHETLHELGKIGAVQFKDVSAYVSPVKHV